MTNDELIAMMRATPEGVLSSKLREMMGLAMNSSHKRLNRLRTLGFLSNVGHSIYTRWCATEHRATALKANERYVRQQKAISAALTLERERARSAGRRRKFKAKKAAEITVEIDDGIDRWPVVQRWVSANDAPMMVKPGPACVWELAA